MGQRKEQHDGLHRVWRRSVEMHVGLATPLAESAGPVLVQSDVDDVDLHARVLVARIGDRPLASPISLLSGRSRGVIEEAPYCGP
jgi:hypothetical protein